LSRIRRGGDPKLELELIFLKLARDYTEPDIEALLSRLETLEKAVENGAIATNPPRSVAPENTTEDSLEEQRPVEPAQEAEPVSDEAPVREVDPDLGGAVDLASEWGGIMGELKRRRQALTAAVYGEARVESFDGNVLRLVFPEEQSFHVGMAKESGHLEKLREVLEERLGSKPHLEVRAADNETLGTVPTKEPPRSEVRVPEPQPAPEERPQESGNQNGSGGTVAEDSGPGRTEGDDVIRDQREVFEIARETGLFDENEDR
jgi:DNA polymerase III subunit gamma/tau